MAKIVEKVKKVTDDVNKSAEKVEKGVGKITTFFKKTLPEFFTKTIPAFFKKHYIPFILCVVLYVLGFMTHAFLWAK